MRKAEKKILKNVSGRTIKMGLNEIKDGGTFETIFWCRLMKRYPGKFEIVEGEVKNEEKKVEKKSEKKSTKKKTSKKSK